MYVNFCSSDYWMLCYNKNKFTFILTHAHVRNSELSLRRKFIFINSSHSLWTIVIKWRLMRSPLESCLLAYVVDIINAHIHKTHLFECTQDSLALSSDHMNKHGQERGHECCQHPTGCAPLCSRVHSSLGLDVLHSWALVEYRFFHHGLHWGCTRNKGTVVIYFYANHAF